MEMEYITRDRLEERHGNGIHNERQIRGETWKWNT